MPKISLIKQGFFNKSSSKVEDFSFTENSFDLHQFQKEFSSIYQLFNANKHHLKTENELVLYLQYLCKVMIQYYRYDYVRESLNDLLKKEKEIAEFINNNAMKKDESSPKKRNRLVDTVKMSIESYIAIFTSSSRAREFVSRIVTNRSYWNYSRTLAIFISRCLENQGILNLIKEFNDKLGHHYSLDDFIRFIESPQSILRALSVSLYLLRFSMSFILMMKHIILAINNKQLSGKKVLDHEIEKRFFSMANDLVWGIVNLLINYNKFFNIPSVVAAQLSLTFLTFDLALFAAHWAFEANHYHKRRNELILQKRNKASPLQLAVINRQLDILNDEWKVQCAYYRFNIFAASLFIVAFGATFLFSGPLILTCLAAISMLGNALYNSAADFKRYRQASIAVERELINSKTLHDGESHQDLLKELTIECSQANLAFWKTLVFNTAATSLLITAAAISWPIAAMLAVSYVAYRLADGYYSHQQSLNKKPINRDIYRLFSPEKSGNSSNTLEQQQLSFQS